MEEQGMRLEDFYIAIKKRWLLILLMVIVPVVLVLIMPKEIVQSNKFQATAKVYAYRNDIDNLPSDVARISIEQNLLNSFVETLKSQSVLNDVADNTSIDVSKITDNFNVSIVRDSSILALTFTADNELDAKLGLDSIIISAEEIIDEIIPNCSLKIVDDVRVTDVTVVSGDSSLKKAILVFIAMSFFAVLLAVTLEYFDDTFKHKEGIDIALKVPVLGVLFRKRKNLNNTKYRKISSNLVYNKSEEQSILITSTSSSENKEEFVCELADNLINMDKRVIVVDLDSKNSISNEKIGLLELINENIKMDSAIVKGTYDLLPLESSDNLEKEDHKHKLSKVLAGLKEKYDYVIINGEAIKEKNTSQIVSKDVDGIIYVVKAYEVKRKNVVDSIEEIRKYNENIIGVVLTNVEM